VTACARTLDEPQWHDPVPDFIENVVGGTQYVSVSWWIGRAAERFLGTDPWQWATEQFTGDWKAVSRAADALANLADFNASFTSTLDSAVQTVGHDWSGPAASRAVSYFQELTSAVRGQIESLDALAEQFTTLATGMYEATNALRGLLEMLLDLVIAATLEAAAAATAGWTVIGGVVAGAAAAATITKALGVWGQILEVHSHTWNAVQGFVGMCAGYLGALESMEAQPLPAGAYASQVGTS
jgi:hypothetical protein